MDKLAAIRSQARRAALTKSAGLASDVLATIPTSMASPIPVLGQLASLAESGGYIGGLVADPEGDGNPATSALSVVPGVGTFRLAQRRRRVMDASNAAGASGTANLVAEHLGGLTSPLISTGVGGLLGAGLGAAIGGRRGARHGAGRGALAGAAIGGIAAPVVAAIAAAIRRKRSKQEQIDSDTTGRAVAKYLVPGLASYDSLKRLGASTHYDAKRKGDKGGKGEKKAAEADYDRSVTDVMVSRPKNYDRMMRWIGVLATAAGAVGGGAAGGMIAGATGAKVSPFGVKLPWGRILGGAGVGASLGAVGGHFAGRAIRGAADELLPKGGVKAFTFEHRYIPVVHNDLVKRDTKKEKKEAEVSGVDPVSLCKSAAPWGLLGKGINAISRFRYTASPSSAMGRAAQRGLNWFAGTRPGQALSRYGSLINGGGVRGYAEQMGMAAKRMQRAQAAGNGGGVLRARMDYKNAARLADNEQKSVDFARNATLLGGGAAAGVAGGYGMGKATGGGDSGYGGGYGSDF